LSQTVKSARLLKGGDVQWKQGAMGLEIAVADAQRDPLDTIVELSVAR
jgi:hypothetical protein